MMMENLLLKKLGDVTIRVEAKDSNHIDTIPVEIQDMAEEMFLPTYAEIGLNMAYRPTPVFTAKMTFLWI